MKETKCVSCGSKIGIDDGTVYGQHVLCPYCGKKFSYLEDSKEFSAERLSYAIAECRKDVSDNCYYSAAPAGARLYIGLVFYGKVFGDGMDLNAYMATLSEIEPELTVSDWQYLLENETDSELKGYFLGKLEGMQGPNIRPTQNLERKPQVPAVGILRLPASKPNLPQNPLVTKRLAEAERHRSESAKTVSGNSWRKKGDGRLVVMAGLVAAGILGVILFLAWPTEPERVSVDVRPTAPMIADAPKPQNALLSAVVGRLAELRERKELVRQSLSEVRADRRRLESELSRVIENGNIRSAAAQAKDRVRLNGAETAIAVLRAPFYNALAARYCGERPFSKADACRKMVQDALAAKKTMTLSAMEAISCLAVSYQENSVGEVRRGMDAASNRLTALSNDIAAAIRTLNLLQGSVAGLEPSQISDKSAELDAMLRSPAFTGQCRMPSIADGVWNAPLQETDEFDVSALCEKPSAEPTSDATGSAMADPEHKAGESHTDEPSKDVETCDRSGKDDSVAKPEPVAGDADDKIETRDEVAESKPKGRRQKCKSPIKCMNFAEQGHKFCADHECHSYGCKEHVRTVSSPNWTLGGLKTLSRLDTAERKLIKRQCIGQYCPKHCCERRCPEIKNYNGWWSGFLYWDNPKVEKFFFCDNERLANSRYCRDHACRMPTCSANREEYWMLENGSSHQEVVAEVDIDYWWLRWDRKWLLHIAPTCRAHSNRDPDSMPPRDLRTSGDLVREKNSH